MSPSTIRTTRLRLGLTQGQAARLVGVEARTWRHWEAGERVMPEPVRRILGMVEDVPEVREWLTRRAYTC